MASYLLASQRRLWTCCRWTNWVLTPMDRKFLQILIEKFQGGPVGIESLAAAIGEDRGTLEDVLEPYLIQEGYILRAPHAAGYAAASAYQHFGLEYSHHE